MSYDHESDMVSSVDYKQVPIPSMLMKKGFMKGVNSRSHQAHLRICPPGLLSQESSLHTVTRLTNSSCLTSS